MTSIQVPTQDLVPAVSSRVVTIDVTDMQEGAPAEGHIDFILPCDLHVASDDKIIRAGSVRVTLEDGKGEVRLPTYDEDARTPDGSDDWVILVKKSWSTKGCSHGRGCGCGGAYAVRVPVGTSSISLADLPAVRPLTRREQMYAITGASITVVDGASWDAEVTLSGGILGFTLTVPPGATAWDKTGVYLTSNDSLQSLDAGLYYVHSGTIAEALGLPVVNLGWLAVNTGRNGAKRVTFTNVDYTGGTQHEWTIATDHTGDWTNARWVRDEDGFHGVVGSDTPYTGLPDGRHAVANGATGLSIGLPSPRPGDLLLHGGWGDSRTAEFTPHRPSGAPEGYEYANSTGANGAWGAWRVKRQLGMRTAPIVLSQPSGDYTTNSSRASWRLPFTVPRTVERIRIHVRAQHYRTGDNWGGMTLQGMAIGNHLGDGAMNGVQEIPGVQGGWVPRVTTQEWVSEWKTVFMTPGEYLFSYEADWTEAYPMKLLAGAAWGNEATGVYADSTNAGYSRFNLQPLEIWLECEVPADVPVYSYFGTSVTMGQSSDYQVYLSYPQLHARRHGAFAAMTAAGGWAIVDDSAQDPAVIGRFGDAGKSDRAYALWGGSNDIRARGATPEEIIAKIQDWLGTAAPLIGTREIYLMTNGAGLSYTGPDDPDFVKLQEVNDWIRKESRMRDDVAGAVDVLSAMSIPGTVWKSDLAFVIGPNDAHPNLAGHKRYADLLSGIYYPEQVPDIGASTTGLLSRYIAAKGV